MIERKDFGQTGLQVSCLGFGAMEFDRLTETESVHLLHRILDEGVNYIDTSPDYRTSEEKIGRALSSSGRRQDCIIATKCGCNPHLDQPGGRHVHTWDAETLRRNIESSLRLLKTDRIDVWQLHGAIPEQLNSSRDHEVIRTMEDMKRQGKVRFIGASLRHGPKTENGYPTAYGYRCIQEYMQWGVFDSIQLVYGAMVRTSENVITHAANHGLAIIVRGIVRDYFDTFPKQFEEAGLNEFFEEGEDRHSFLIRYALTHPSVSVGIIGTANEEHFLANARAARKGALSADTYRIVQQRLASAGSSPEMLDRDLPETQPS